MVSTFEKGLIVFNVSESVCFWEYWRETVDSFQCLRGSVFLGILPYVVEIIYSNFRNASIFVGRGVIGLRLPSALGGVELLLCQEPEFVKEVLLGNLIVTETRSNPASATPDGHASLV